MAPSAALQMIIDSMLKDGEYVQCPCPFGTILYPASNRNATQSTKCENTSCQYKTYEAARLHVLTVQVPDMIKHEADAIAAKAAKGSSSSANGSYRILSTAYAALPEMHKAFSSVMASHIHPAYANEESYWKANIPPLSMEDDTSGLLKELAIKLNAIYATQTSKKKEWLDKFRNTAGSGCAKTDIDIIDNIIDELNNASV